MTRKKQQTIKFRRSLFWDVDPKTISPKKHARYIIERVLDFGNNQETKWLFHFYRPALIKDTLEKSRGVIHDKSKALWSLILK